VSLSTDAGATWLYHSAGAFYAEPNLSRVSLAQPEVLHYEHGARLGDDLFRVSEEGGSLVRVALLEHLALNFGVHWISDTYPAWQRVIRDGDLLETWDGWDNAVVLTAFNRDAYDKLVVLHEASTTRQDWMILGSRGSWIEGGYPHSIYALDQTNNPGVVVGKSGASPSASPYTDSIPYVHEGLIFDGIRVLA
jgi:hypothetical protein